MLSSQIKTIETDLMEEKQQKPLMTKNFNNRFEGCSQTSSPQQSKCHSKMRQSHYSDFQQQNQRFDPQSGRANLAHIQRSIASNGKYLNASPTMIDSISLCDSIDKMGATWGSKPSANFRPLESERISNKTKNVWSFICKANQSSAEKSINSSLSPPRDRIKERKAIMRARNRYE